MKKLLKALVCAGVCALSQLSLTDLATASPSDDRDLMAANAGFYAALNNVFKGDVAAMDTVWSHRDDVSYMGPDGHRNLGWNAVRNDWLALASKQLGGKVELAQVRVQSGDTMSAVSGVEVGENVIDGKPQQVSIRATNIFRKEGGTWKMIAHHTDKLPHLGQ